MDRRVDKTTVSMLNLNMVCPGISLFMRKHIEL